MYTLYMNVDIIYECGYNIIYIIIYYYIYYNIIIYYNIYNIIYEEKI